MQFIQNEQKVGEDLDSFRQVSQACAETTTV
jgi:hypothetical protein